MRTFTRLQEESSKIGAEFLITKLDSALVLLNIAETTVSAETRGRTQKSAQDAYDTVLPLQHRVKMTPGQKAVYLEKLSALQLRLKARTAAVLSDWGHPWVSRPDDLPRI